MANESALFRNLERDVGGGTLQAQALRAKKEGEAPSTDNGSIAFAFKDSLGNLVLPSLTPDGAFNVNLDPGTPLAPSRGVDTTGSKTGTPVVLTTPAELTLTVGEKYNKIMASVKCLRETLFQIVHIDDVGGAPTETILDECLVGPGMYSFNMQYGVNGQSVLDLSGGTGVQKIEVRYDNIDKESNVYATLHANQIAS